MKMLTSIINNVDFDTKGCETRVQIVLTIIGTRNGKVRRVRDAKDVRDSL